MTSAARGGGKLPLPDFLADIEEDLRQGLLPAQIYNNRQIYELEMERIFARCWVFIGHETEIPNQGDYAARNIGEDPFIFVRGEDNVIRVLFNGCRHRGGQVCLDVGWSPSRAGRWW